MTNFPLAIFEGPRSGRVAGWRHVLLVFRGRPSLWLLSSNGGRLAAQGFNCPHYPAGTWENWHTSEPGNWTATPGVRSEILAEIHGEKEPQQKELIA